MSSSRLYQKPYPPEFDFVSYLASWRILEFVKFNGDDSRITWEHVSQYILQLREAGLNDTLCNTRFIKEHKPSNHIRAEIKSHVYTTE